MGSLLDSIKNSISPDTIRSIASSAGESPDGVKKGLETAAATMLGSIAGKAGDSGFLSQIMSLASSFGTQTLGAAAGAGGAATAAAKLVKAEAAHAKGVAKLEAQLAALEPATTEAE